MKNLIQRLVETYAPSGYEAPIRDVIRAEVEPLVDEVRIDALGNLIAIKHTAKATAKKVMVAGHMDEIGVIITHIDDNGFMRFTNIGGVRANTCMGGRVRFLDGSTGLISFDRPEDASKIPTLEQLYIDVGAASRKENPHKPGEVAAFDRPFVDLGNRLVAKSMDDRIGVAVMIEALRQLSSSGNPSPHQLYFVFSTQEEVGVRGATTAAYSIDPDLGLSVDVTGTGDTPKSAKMEVGLGGGPAIKVRDGGMLADPRVVDWMASTAKREKLPYQLEILEAGSTDARAIQLTRAGVLAGCLSIPCRYVHSPSEMVDYNDVQNAVRLMVALLRNPVNL